MILQALSWYFILTILGWLSFPITFSVFSNLRDRGFGLSRVFGLLLWGFIFWLSTSFGFSRNTPAGILFSLLLLLSISLYSIKRIGLTPFILWYKENKTQIWILEGLFAIAFLAMVLVRGANPEALGTEKPMELAFINAIIHSETFPPHDPWLSGYAISYYYFGYILVAMLAKISAVPGSVAFNLGISSIFALSAVSAYSVVSNLLSAHYQKTFLWRPLIAPLLALCVGNIEGFLEVIHALGLFWRQQNGQWVSPFWKWLDLVELTSPPQIPFTAIPSRWYWWWRASRVIQDYDLAGNLREVIDEFPAFSYILADLHPHVLAMPFAFLAMAVALNLFLHPATDKILPFPTRKNSFSLQYPLAIPLGESLLIALILGSLAFLNTWDFPIYVMLCALAYSLWHWRVDYQNLHQNSKSLFTFLRFLLKDLIGFGLWTGVWGAIFYLPFYIGFSSQAGGILPNLIYPSRGAQLWIMFAPLWIPVIIWSGYNIFQTRTSIKSGVVLSLGLFFTLWLLSIAMGWLISLIPHLNDLFLGTIAATDSKSWLIVGIQRRWLYFGGWFTLLLILSFAISLLWYHVHPSTKSTSINPDFSPDSVIAFVLLLTIIATLLVLIPDFFFLRDQFGWRINTVFKFYYQAWLMGSVAAAYFICTFPTISSKAVKTIFLSISFLGIGLGLVYSVLATLNKTNAFHPPEGWTLDSSAYYLHQSYDEMQGIQWLSDQPYGVIAEAVSPTGGSYTQYARVATFSGLPAVLGWTGHESQWRGGASEMGSRQPDLIRLYCSHEWIETWDIIQKYSIKYIFIGDLERNTYTRGSENCPDGINEQKFQNNLIPIFQQGNVTIYLVP